MSFPVQLLYLSTALALSPTPQRAPLPDAAPAPLAAPAAAGMAWADVDVDGLEDLLAVDAQGGAALLRNAGDGRLVDVTAKYGLGGLSGVVGASWTDVDADGLPDLLLVGQDGRARLWRHFGAFFQDVSASAGLDQVQGVAAAAWFDYDRDGRADLMLAGSVERVLLHNLGEFVFEPVALPENGRVTAGLPLEAEREAANPANSARANEERTDGSRPAAAGGGSSGSGPIGLGGTSAAANRSRAGGTLPALACALTLSDLSGGPCIPADSAPQLGALYPLSFDFNLASSGDVGMGTLTPLAPLHVSTTAVGLSPTALSNDVGVFESARSEVGAYSLESGNYGSAFVLAEIGPDSHLTDKWGLVRRTAANGSTLHFTHGSNADPATNAQRLNLSPEGHLGVSTFAGDETLRVVHGDIEADGSRFSILNSANKSNAILANTLGTGAALYASAPNGAYGVRAYGKGGVFASAGDGDGVYASSLTGNALHGQSANGTPLLVEKTGGAGSAALMTSTAPLWTLYVANAGSTKPKAAWFGGEVEAGYASSFGGLPVVRSRIGVDGTNAGYAQFLNDNNEVTITLDANLSGNGRITTDELVIKGGADLVEGFDVRGEAVEPGTVLVIDELHAGELRVASEPYDRRVAGVVSGAGGIRPGLHMGQEGVASGDTPVAMTGRVYVRASAENGAIRPGDRLTTSATPGHAMRVSEGAACDGAVIGKAMGALDQGSGLVLVLVNLQ